MSDTEGTISPGAASDKPPQRQSGRRRRKPSDTARRLAIEVFMPVVIGLVGYAFFYYIVLPLLPEANVFRDKFEGPLLDEQGARGSSFVQRLCTILLFWHLSHVLLRLFKHIRPEFGVLEENPIPASASELTDDDLQEITERAIEMERRRGGSLLTRRLLLAVAHLGIRRDTSELGDLLRRRAEADRHRAANAYAIPNFIFWAIPILGFVGTVLGIGAGIANLKGTLGQVEDVKAVVAQLDKVAGNLGVAFDTTLVALLMSIVAYLVQTLVRQQEARLLADVEDYLTYRLQSRVRSGDDSPVADALKELQQTQERIAEDESERATMSMQTMMSSQESLKDVLAKLPGTVATAANSTNALLQGMDQKLAGISETIERSIRGAFGGVRDEFAEAVTNQVSAGEQLMDRLESSAQEVSGLITTAGQELRAEFGRLGAEFGDQVMQAADHTANVLEMAGDKTSASLAEVASRLDVTMTDGKELLNLQSALRENLDQLVRIQRIDETFGQVRDALVLLQPVLERLTRPVPVRLTLTGVDLPDAAKGDGDGGWEVSRVVDVPETERVEPDLIPRPPTLIDDELPPLPPRPTAPPVPPLPKPMGPPNPPPSP